MRFEFLVAQAFGPFIDRRLDFSEGLNVVHGPNESGKSSWHAALFAGLCGMRRGRGQRNEDLEFANRHRPWDGSAWKVGLTLSLQDGRRVELLQDLDSRTATVTDADLGRDYTGEIIYDGAPDGSCWLGLNREVFPVIAFVRQAQILEVLQDPDALQRYLQRAADTQGIEGTAAQAIEALRSFRGVQIGVDRANVRRPLRLAREACDEAKYQLQKALGDHTAYEDLLSDLVSHKSRLQETIRKKRLVQALQARFQAEAVRRHFDEARELQTRFPDGPPAGLASRDKLMQDAAAVLEAFRSRPATVAFPTPSVADLEMDLSRLPELPGDELAPDPAVVQAHRDLSVRIKILEDYHRRRPEPLAAPNAGGASVEALKAFAAALEEDPPAFDHILEKQHAELEKRVAAGKTRKVASLVLSVVAAGSGLLCLLLGLWGAGLALLAMAGAAIAWAFLRGSAASLKIKLEELKRLDTRCAKQQYEKEGWIYRTEQARRNAETLGLEASPARLRDAAESLLQLEERGRQIKEWEGHLPELECAYQDCMTNLNALLDKKGEPLSEGPDASFSSYILRCRQRTERFNLKQKLAQAKEATFGAAESRRLLAEVHSRLQDIAMRCEVAGEDPDQLAHGLEAWLKQQSDELVRRGQALQQWQHLQHLLNGGTLADLEREASRYQGLAAELAADFSSAELDNWHAEFHLLEESCRVFEEEEKALETEVVKLQTRLEEREQLLIPVAEAEEALKAAEDELARVRRLDWTLEKTLTFLEEAQHQVHRSIAPALAASVRNWLPRVTAGRYADVRVDPKNLRLSVQEATGVWREAALLSHGTTEQIYLLLRIALAQYLIQPKEVTPLVLDDVTVQSDAERTKAILATLLSLSEERQIVLFSQEDEVLAWAQENLAGSRHRLTLLASPIATANR